MFQKSLQDELAQVMGGFIDSKWKDVDSAQEQLR